MKGSTYKVNPFNSFIITFSFLFIEPDKEIAFQVSPRIFTSPSGSRGVIVLACCPIIANAPDTGFVFKVFKPIPTTKRKNNAVTVVVESITVHEREAIFSSGLLRNKIMDPMSTEMIPPMVSKP